MHNSCSFCSCFNSSIAWAGVLQAALLMHQQLLFCQMLGFLALYLLFVDPIHGQNVINHLVSGVALEIDFSSLPLSYSGSFREGAVSLPVTSSSWQMVCKGGDSNTSGSVSGSALYFSWWFWGVAGNNNIITILDGALGVEQEASRLLAQQW